MPLKDAAHAVIQAAARRSICVLITDVWSLVETPRESLLRLKQSTIYMLSSYTILRERLMSAPVALVNAAGGPETAVAIAIFPASYKLFRGCSPEES